MHATENYTNANICLGLFIVAHWNILNHGNLAFQPSKRQQMSTKLPQDEQPAVLDACMDAFWSTTWYCASAVLRENLHAEKCLVLDDH